MTVRHTFTCAKCQSLRLILHTNGEMNSNTGRFRCLPKYHGFDASPHDSLRWFPAAAPSHEQAPQQCPTVISFADTRAFWQRNTCYKQKVKWYGDIIFFNTQSWKTYGSKWSSEEIDTNKWNVISTLSTQKWLIVCPLVPPLNRPKPRRSVTRLCSPLAELCQRFVAGKSPN